MDEPCWGGVGVRKEEEEEEEKEDSLWHWQ